MTLVSSQFLANDLSPIDHIVISALPLLLLCIATMLLQRAAGDKHSAGRDQTSNNAFAIVSLAGALAFASVLCLWAMVGHMLSNCRSDLAHTHQNFVPLPFPLAFTSSSHVMSLLIAGLAYWLPLNFPAQLTSKHSLRFRTTRDHVALLGSIFAFQAFVFRPQPNQLDSLLIGPLALVTLALYEPPLPPLKEEAQVVSSSCAGSQQ